MTAYSAKAALARLRLAARQTGKPEPKGIWRIMPLHTAVRSLNGEAQSRIIGGWIVKYEDTLGKSRVAELNCWGEVKIENETPNPTIAALPPVALSEIVLDHSDAHALVLARGGAAAADGPVGWLMNIQVDGRGPRPVWGGEAWTLGGPGKWVMIDAYSGELYRPSEGDRLQPFEANQPRLWKEWDGGFDAESADAKAGKQEAEYLWPRAYAASRGGYVYNRARLQADIGIEEDRAERAAASWMTSGLLQAALGDWVKADRDLTKAIELDPESDVCHQARGLAYLVIRDLNRAEADFEKVKDAKERGECLTYVATCRGTRRRELASVMRAMNTNVGLMPLYIQFGETPLAAPPAAPPGK
ncbi:MAG: hypothetical protein JSR77_15130 [Planctomycetes bacterium]|nr:hypothetical protein [Planctomycetota bacterium]